MHHEYTIHGQTITLDIDPSVVAVRFTEPAPHSVRQRICRDCALGSFRQRVEVPEESFTILPLGDATLESTAPLMATGERLRAIEAVTRVAPVFRMGARRMVATDRVAIGITGSTIDGAALAARYGATIMDRYGEGEYLLRLQPTDDPFEVARQLSAEPGIDYAQPDFVTMGRHVPTQPPGPGETQPAPAAGDPLRDRQYAIAITEAIAAWRKQTGQPEITIAILDEGVDTDHPDLAAAITGAYDGVDRDEWQEPMPWDAHGTACAGLAAAIHDNAQGIMGIAGGCSIQAVRIAFSQFKGANWTTTDSWIRSAIDWSWQNGADVLSNSWGGGAYSQPIVNAFARARAQGRGGLGCVVVVAAGNESGPVSFPGNVPEVLTVSASNEYDEFKTKTSQDGETWWGSNFGPQVDVAAPGVHNLTTDILGNDGYAEGDYTNFNGTSSATPIVAGACALVLSARPTLTQAQVMDIIRATADKVGAEPYDGQRNDQMGHGRVNVRRAVDFAVLETPPSA